MVQRASHQSMMVMKKHYNDSKFAQIEIRVLYSSSKYLLRLFAYSFVGRLHCFSWFDRVF